MPNDQFKVEDNRSSEDKIVWQDGVITDAFINSKWILLDNLNQTESSVLERLNPVLEDPPVWTLTEKGESMPLDAPNDFRLFATMSPPVKGVRRAGQTSFGELSPALYNRFSIIHMDDLNIDNKQEFIVEMKLLIEQLTNCNDQDEINKIIQILLFVIDEKTFPILNNLTYRNFIRFLNCIERFKGNKANNNNFNSILWTSFKLVFESQIKNLDGTRKDTIEENVKKLIATQDWKQLQSLKFLENLKKISPNMCLLALVKKSLKHYYLVLSAICLFY